MNKKRVIMVVGVLVLILMATSAFVPREEPRSPRTLERVYWNWDVAAEENPVGFSLLSRDSNQIGASYFTSELPAGQAMTLWFIVFNYPELCTEDEGGCSFDDMGKDTAAQGDFLLADGKVIGSNGYAWFQGSLTANDTSGSGLAEMGGCIEGYDDCGGPVGLVNPKGAVVNLAVHSHGPALTGANLENQLNSFLGGCEDFLGAGGFAGGFDELPSVEGECSTIQQSIHAPK